MDAASLFEQSAFDVEIARNFRELEAACRRLRFRVAVLGPSLGDRMKKAVALLLQQRCPDVPIIEVVHGMPVVEHAIHFAGEPGPELIKTVKAAIARM